MKDSYKVKRETKDKVEKVTIKHDGCEFEVWQYPESVHVELVKGSPVSPNQMWMSREQAKKLVKFLSKKVK